MRVLPDYEIVRRTGPEPILLTGTPERLTGEILLNNPGDKRVVVRAARIRQIPREAMRSQEAVQEVPARMLAILRPGQDARARVQVHLDPSTPPGQYQAQLALGDHGYPAVLHVTENVALDISPDSVAIENRPGSRSMKQIVVRNRGNVPLTIGSPGPVPLDEELIRCRTLRATLAEGYDKAVTWEEWLTTFLREGKKSLDKAGMLWVQNREGEVAIEPGTARTVDFDVRQPDTNDPASRYVGVAFLYTADLTFAVLPSGYLRGREPGSGENGQNENESPRRSARKRSRSSE